MEDNQEKRNNARMIIQNRHIPVTNIEVYDLKKEIYTGDVVKQTMEYEQMGFHIVFFSRHYDPENEYDKILKEYDFEADDTLLGIPFTLIPQQKILFIFDPPTKGIKQVDGKIIHLAKPPIRIPTRAEQLKTKRGGVQ